ncbi:MAG: hypothetical protein JWP78_663 [Mucilaginibacter sp.]|nr:hypothetical protein [Mucilaginibacter sp.]
MRKYLWSVYWSIATYSSHFKKPRDGQQMHIILIDNGRSVQLGRKDFRNSLNASGGEIMYAGGFGEIESIITARYDACSKIVTPIAELTTFFAGDS